MGFAMHRAFHRLFHRLREPPWKDRSEKGVLTERRKRGWLGSTVAKFGLTEHSVTASDEPGWNQLGPPHRGTAMTGPGKRRRGASEKLKGGAPVATASKPTDLQAARMWKEMEEEKRRSGSLGMYEKHF
jgi:hypothetical protein